jgi:fibronectin-binding autotransporter adhesin
MNTTVIFGKLIDSFIQRKPLPCASLLFLFLASISSAQAASDTWVGNASANFSTGGWTGGNNPPVSTDTLTFGTAGTAGTTLNDDQTGLDYGAITFSSGASAYTIGGNAFTLGNGTANTVVTNSSGTLETINDNITFGNAVQTIALTSGGLTLGGTTAVAGTASGFSLTGGGTLTIKATGTLSGTTATGVVSLANTAGETLAITNNSTVTGVLTGGGSTGGTLSIAAGSTFISITSQTTVTYSGSVTGAGTLELGQTNGTPKYVFSDNMTGFTGVVDFVNSEVRFVPQTSSPTFTIELAGGGIYTAATPSTVANNIELASTGGYIRVNNSGATAEVLSGAVTGTGTFVLASNNFYNLTGNWTSTNAFTSPFTGTVQIGSTTGPAAGTGTVSINSATSSDANAAYVLVNSASASSTLNSGISGGGTVNLGSLSSTLNSTFGGIVENNVASTTATFSVGNLNTNTSFAGIVQNGTGSAEITALTKVGSGSLTLSGANTYTGATTVTAGTLQAGVSFASSAGAFGNGSSALTVNSGTVDLNGFNEQVGSLAGSGGTVTNNSAAASHPSILTVNNTGLGTSYAGTIANGSVNTVGLALASTDTGTLDLTGADTYTGATTISAGTLQVGGGTGSLGGTSGNFTALTMGTSATLVLGDSAGIGAATVSSLATSGSGDAILGGNGAMSTLTVAYTNSLTPDTFSGSLGSATGNGNNLALTKTGAGVLALSGASTYTGSTTVTGGTLQVTGSLGSTAVSVGSGATLSGNGNGTSTGIIGGAATINGGGTLALATSSGTLTINGVTLGSSGSFGSPNLGTAAFTLSGASVELLNVGTSGTGTLSVNTGGGYIDILGTATIGTYTLADYGLLVGASNLSLSSSSVTTTLNVGRQTYTLLEGGTALQLQVTGAPVPTLAYFDGAVSSNWSDLSNATLVNWSTDLAGTVDAGNLPGSTSDVVLNASNAAANRGSSTITEILGTPSGIYTVNSITVNGNATTTIGADGSVLALNAAGTANNTAGVGITIAAGANPFTINTPITINASQSWTNNSANVFTVGGNVAGTPLINTTQTLTLSNTSTGSTTINGSIANGGSGTLTLVVNNTGSGVTTLSGSNTYSGGTTLNGGTLTSAVTSGFSTGFVTVNPNGATATAADNATLNTTGAIASTAAVTVNSEASDGGFGIGTINFNGATPTIGSLAGSGNVVLNNASGTTLTISPSSGTTTFSGVISSGTGTSSLTKAGAGTEILTNVETYTGTTKVSGGALNIQNSNTLADSTAVTVSSGAALQLQGGITPALHSLTLNGQGVTANQEGALESVSGANSYSGSITLGSASAIGVDAGTFNVSGPISGGVALTLTGSSSTGTGTLASALGTNITSLTKNGASTWDVTNANTYTGGTTLNAGTLQAGVATTGTTSGAFGGQNAAFTEAGGTLDLDGNNVGLGAFNSTGGTITDSGAAATLTVGNNNGAINLTGISAVSGPLTINITGSGAWTNNPGFTSTVSSGGGLEFTNNALFRMDSLATNLGTNGTLIFNGGGQVQTGAGSGAPTVTLASTNAIVINGAGNVWSFQTNTTTPGAWTGTGTIQISQGNAPTFTFGGNMTGFDGTLQLFDGTGAGASDTFALSDATTNQIGGASAVWSQQSASGSTGTDTLAWTGAGSQIIPLGDLNTTGNAGTALITLINKTAGTTATWQVGNLGLNSTYSGVIGSNGTGISALEKVGAGTWTLTGANTYTGATEVNAGILQIGNGTSGSINGTSGVTVDTNGTLDVEQADATSFTPAITDNGLVNGNEIVSTTNTFTGAISGNGAFTQNGPGTSVFATANSYLGATTVNGGALLLGAANGVGSSSVVTVNTGTFGIGAFNDTVGGLSLLGGSVTGSTGTLTSATDYDLENGTVSAILGGAGINADIQGGAVVTLSGANTFTGLTSVFANSAVLYENGTAFGGNSPITVANGGEVQVEGNIAGGSQSLTLRGSGNSLNAGAAGALENVSGNNSYSGSITLASASTISSDAGTLALTGGINDSSFLLTFAGAGNTTVGTAAISGSNGVRDNATGTVTFIGANGYTGTTTIANGATLQLGDGTSGHDGTISGSPTVADSGSLVYNTFGSTSYGGLISGSGSVTVIGSGTTTLSNANTYLGGTTVNAGTFVVTNANGSATGSGQFTLASGATLAGTGAINSSGFTIGAASSPVATVLVGQTAASDNNTTHTLTLTDAGGSTITNTNLVFNLNTATNTGSNAGNQLNVGTTGITFSGSSLTLNLVGSTVIAANTPYVLLAGTGGNGDGTLAGSQYSGLGTSGTVNGNLVLTGLTLNFTGSEPPAWYSNSYVFLVNSGGVDDIEVEVVPEPSTWAMMLGGLGLLLCWQRRKNRMG